MLCVPVDEEIPEVSDSVVKAITGASQALFFRRPQQDLPHHPGYRDPVRFSDEQLAISASFQM